MADAENVYKDLRDALEKFKAFLTAHGPELKKAAVFIDKALNGELFKLLDQLIALLNTLKTTIDNIKVGNIPGLDQVSDMAKAIEVLLGVSQTLLTKPEDQKNVQEALKLVKIVTGLPTLDSAKGEIIGLINDVIAQLEDIKKTQV